MKTLIIKIDSLNKDTKKYPIRLFLDEGAADWLQTPVGESEIPEDLSIDNPPIDPVTKEAVDIKEARNIVLTDSNNSQRFKAIGEYLFRLLSQGPFGTKWAAARKKYPNEIAGSEGLRTILDITPPQLQALAWELLFIPKQGFLFADPTNPFVRGNIDYDSVVKPYILPIRALIVVACEEDDPVIDWQEEVEGIENSFWAMRRNVECEIIFRPSKKKLIDYLEDYLPHILHIIGHGKQLDNGNGNQQENRFFLEVHNDESGDKWQWMADEIPMDLPRPVPRFAFINACRSGDSNNEEMDSWGIAGAFVAAGVPAALGMLADIRTDVATTIARSLYQSFAKKEPLDIALAQARRDVAKIEDIGWESREWALASLSFSVRPEDVLPLRLCVKDTQQLKSIEEAFASVRDFVNRREQRRDLWRKVDPDVGEYQDLLVIEGETEVGKSALMEWCLEGCALRGRRIVHIDADRKPTNFVEIIRLIKKDLSSKSPINQPLRADAFFEFNRRLNFLVKGTFPVPPTGGSTEDEGHPWLSGDRDIINEIFSSFREALKLATGDLPLIIALDHLNLLEDQFEKYFWPELIDHIKRRALPQVRMLLTLSSGDVNRYSKEIPSLARDTIKVKDFEAEDFKKLAREFCRHNDMDLNDIDELIDLLANKVKSNWKPSKFDAFRALKSRGFA